MDKKFPVYKDHVFVFCFNCGDRLLTSIPIKSGFGYGNGEYVKDCPKCGMKTWYDIEK